MTLREFIEQEIMEDHVFDIEEFGKSYISLNLKTGKKSNPKNLRII